jgi:Uncharacterised nucleotidyltransferase
MLPFGHEQYLPRRRSPVRWSAPADKRIVEAVVATFRDPAEASYDRLGAFAYPDWIRTYYWLDASGMALYFLHQLEDLRIEGALPAATLGRLRQNLADNRDQSASTFAEFSAINQAFRQADVRYCNLKGFTLLPDSCPDPTLRCQLDLDFLVRLGDLERCREMLAAMGYVLMGVTDSVWEFKTGASEVPSIEDHYRPKAQRSVELHFAFPATVADSLFPDLLLDRRIMLSWGGQTFPALSDGDRFVGQAMHLFKHLCSSHTRIAWLLEYKRQVSARQNDVCFWEEVRERSEIHRDAFIAIGLATLLSSQLFGEVSPAQLNDWTLNCLPPPVRLWAECYGREALLADFPGTKLYLLLRGQLAHSDGSWQQEKRSSLLPIHRAPKIVRTSMDDSLTKRLRGNVDQWRFILFRLRFHVTQGLRYAVEALRWKRRVAAIQQRTPCCGAKADCPNPIGGSRVEKI